MHSVGLELTKLILIGSRTTYQATGDAGSINNKYQHPTPTMLASVSPSWFISRISLGDMAKPSEAVAWVSTDGSRTYWFRKLCCRRAMSIYYCSRSRSLFLPLSPTPTPTLSFSSDGVSRRVSDGVGCWDETGRGGSSGRSSVGQKSTEKTKGEARKID